jgi:predicted nucleotide-binding protein
MAQKKKVIVFYSWQSDSPKKTNLNAIRNALKAAAKAIEVSHPDLTVVSDEATRDTSGSPNIALKILEKVAAADVFLADLTTITSPRAKRPCPNPNVDYELGYAVGELGWDRVILMFNTAFGKFPGDLPFDIIQQRASPYKLVEADPHSAHKPLEDLVKAAILAVISKNPKRPSELRGLSPDKLRHDQDVTNMKWLMSNVHVPTMDTHIEELPHRFTDRALFFSDVFNGVIENSLFNLYDPVLKAAVDKLYLAWRAALSYDQEYDSKFGKTYVFTNPLDLPLPKRRQQHWDEIDAARVEMRRALDEILARLRADYVEIDLHKTNEDAWKYYREIQKEVQAGLSDEIAATKPRKGNKAMPTRKLPKAKRK